MTTEQDRKINKFIVEYKNRRPNVDFEGVARAVRRKFGKELSSSAVNHRYLRAMRGESFDEESVYIGRRRGVEPHRYTSVTELGWHDGNILVIGDTHVPFHHGGYLDFCLSVQEKYACTFVIHIGDVVDQNALSSFVVDPDGLSAGQEYDLVCDALEPWYAEFPEVKVCIGNHDRRHLRQARSAGIPFPFMRTYEELWECAPGWEWGQAWELNGIMFEHGAGGGKLQELTRARDGGQSLVMGHIHTTPGVKYYTNRNGAVFGMNVGCGLDFRKYAFAYAGQQKVRPTLGCGVVLSEDDGYLPMFIPFREV